MRRNEEGGTLVYVLLIILVFSILGMALMGNAVSETKRAEKTESEIQAKHLALNGLTYFETDFKAYIQTSDAINIPSFLEKYQEWAAVGSESNPNEMQIKVKLHLADEKNIEVWSKGTVGNTKKTIKSYYMLDYEMNAEPGSPIYDIPDFTQNGATALNFGNDAIIELGLGPILNLELVKLRGSDKKFYRVPDDEIVKVGLLGLIGISIGDGERFRTVETQPVIATREGTVLGLTLLGYKEKALVKVNLFSYKSDDDTNVLINGIFTPFKLIGEVNRYRDIDFKKFAVMGNCLIQQDRDGTGLSIDKDNGVNPRRFTFQDGLYVNRSLVIGGEQDKKGAAKNRNDYSKLMLRGDMVVMEKLMITDVDLQIGDSIENELGLTKDDYFTGMYVQGDAEIKNACIKTNTNYGLGLFAQGKLTIENNAACNTFSGLYYAEKGIKIKTNGMPMTIEGGLVGNVEVDYPEMLTVKEEYDLLPKIKITNVDLIPQGRAIVAKNTGD